MSRFARVESIEALKHVRVMLCMFADRVKAGLGEAEADIQRVDLWLKNDAQRRWKSEIRKRTERVNQAKLALLQKKVYKDASGGRPSCVDEEKALARAKRQLEEAKQKHENVRRWTRLLDEEVFEYKSAVQGLERGLESDIPNALARLDNMITSLESYVSLAAPTSQATATETVQTGMATMSRELPDMTRPSPTLADQPKRLRQLTPDAQTRDQAAVTQTDLDWPEPPDSHTTVLDAITRLGLMPVPVKPSDKIIVAIDCSPAELLYLERTESRGESDSGWYIGPASDHAGRTKAISVAELLAKRPAWQHVLTLPPGYLVVLCQESIEVIFDAEDRAVWPAAHDARSS